MKGAPYEVVPVTGRAAAKWIAETHRHLPRLQGALFAVGVTYDGHLVGVATAGNPARVWQGTGRVIISRVATDGTPNTCSMLYGAICRAAKALGYREAWTYTLAEEPGTSLRAAGFQDMGLTRAEEWSRPSRSRAPAARADSKRRWMRSLSPPHPVIYPRSRVMRVLVCGGRDFTDQAFFDRTMDALHDDLGIQWVIEGGARGADRFAYEWAAINCVRVDHYPADWNAHGRAAGPIRNQRMLDEGKPAMVVAFPGGHGTADMVKRAERAGVAVIEVKGE